MHQQITKQNSESQGLSSLVNVSYHNTPYQLCLYENSIRFLNFRDLRHPGPKEPALRGYISEFSRASRKRLLRLFASIRLAQLPAPVFITLTYHHGYKVSPFEASRNLNTWLQFCRNRLQGLHYIWRLEFQKRGAPHFHVILWTTINGFNPISPWTIQALSDAWHRIADPKSIAHQQYGFKLDRLDSYRKAFAYISKYVAKEDNRPRATFHGRRWGKSANLPIIPVISFCVEYDVYMRIRKALKDMVRKSKKAKKEFIEYVGSPYPLHMLLPFDQQLFFIFDAFDSTSFLPHQHLARAFLDRDIQIISSALKFTDICQ